MKFVLLTVVAAATIGLAAGTAEARDLSIPHKPFAKMTVHQKANWLKRQIHKDVSVIRFWKNHRYLTDADVYAPVDGVKIAVQARKDVKWASTSLRIAKKNLAELTRALAAAKPRYVGGSVTSIICQVFGPYCSQALVVSDCESGYSTIAKNGQYLGIFQMGTHERATYGDGPDALSQAQAAYRYFVSSGKDWSPWSCKP